MSGIARDDHKLKRVRVRIGKAKFRTAKCRWRGSKCRWAMRFNSDNYADRRLRVLAVARDAAGNRSRDVIRVRVDNTPDVREATIAEGTTIEILVPGWTQTEIAGLLRDNGLDDRIGPSLRVKVQDLYASQVVASASTSGGSYSGFAATMYLNPHGAFGVTPDATVGHEFGHVWAAYYRYLAQQGDWSGYLDARGLSGDGRLESSYAWGKEEIIADDYRLLFGSSSAVAQRPKHMNPDIAAPGNVAGLKNYLSTTWTEGA